MARRDVIYQTYNNARLRGEKVIFIDGHSLFPPTMREECTVDNCTRTTSVWSEWLTLSEKRLNTPSH
ncbi:MAG: hypothetical protein ACLR5G_11375 [Eubacteriales bacterium]